MGDTVWPGDAGVVPTGGRFSLAQIGVIVRSAQNLAVGFKKSLVINHFRIR